nr:MAG TPA: hypothetical protein [Caudoviricetes sp.]
MSNLFDQIKLFCYNNNRKIIKGVFLMNFRDSLAEAFPEGA